MDIKVWNKYQLEMFDRLSNYNKEVSFKEVVDSYKSDIETWGYFDGILLDNVEDYDRFSSVSNVIYSNGYFLWNHYCKIYNMAITYNTNWII